ncbi:MAG: ABC transporter ATP-binding protein [Candidatus Thorarchaeota archaeon]
MSPFKRRVFILSILLVVNMALQVINPQIIRFYIDTVTQPSPQELFTNAALLYIAIAIVQQMTLIASVYISQDLAWGSTNALRSDLFQHCVNLDMTFHNEHRPGDMIERIDGDVNTLSNFLSQFTILILANVLVIGGILAILFLEDVRLGIAFSLFALFASAALYRTRNIATALWRKVREIFMKLMGMLEETLTGTEDIKGCGAKGHSMGKYFNISRKAYDLQMKASTKTSIMIMVIYGMEALSATLVFGIGVPFLNDGVISLGTVVLIHLYAGLLLRPIMRILRQLQEIQLASASIERIKVLNDTESKLIDDGTSPIPEGPITLEFDQIFFEYEEDTPVLRDVSFNLEQGRVLGLIGPTGSGKTTISRLIFRLYETNSGTLMMNDVNISNVPLKSLRSRVAMVTQDVQLFEASLKDNITLFDRSIPDERILEVIREVGLGNWYDSLEKGLDTIVVGDVGLSAGESQLLALSRVFLQDPSLVILDEASSRLDPVTEGLIEQALDKLLLNRTAIIIAHRLSTLDRVDDILLLDQGSVLEYGERERLADDPSSKFYRLLRTGIMEVLV